jgi:Aromatic-ring-opening dioxygenase LigAB, LigA subunit
MSVYAVNKLCRRVVHEPQLREALASDPEAALRTAQPPLSDEELRALLAGDVGTLSKMGCNHFLLHQLGRWQVLGLDLPLYAERIRAAHRDERPSSSSPSA